MQHAGVYEIRNVRNGRRYIGSSKNMQERFYKHRGELRRGVHHSFILQRAWDKHGEDAFEFKPLVLCADADLLLYEKALMPLAAYNVLRTPRRRLVQGGWKHSAEFKAEVAARFRGKPLSEEHRRKISTAARGRVYDAAFREKARVRATLNPPAKEVVERMQNAGRAWAAARERTLRDRVAEVKQRVAGGVSVAAACKQVGVSNATFYAYCPGFNTAECRKAAGTQLRMTGRAVRTWCPELQVCFLCYADAEAFFGAKKGAAFNAVANGAKVNGQYRLERCA